SDLYSLGCTLYYLLSGQVPFPGNNMMEKLIKHRLYEPTPVEQLRPDVPAPVAAVVRRLMAKEPGDRFQTPLELASTLASLAGPSGSVWLAGLCPPAPLPSPTSPTVASSTPPAISVQPDDVPVALVNPFALHDTTSDVTSGSWSSLREGKGKVSLGWLIAS